MFKTLYDTNNVVNYNGYNFTILTFLVEHDDGLAVEYWYMTKNSGVMRFSYGEMLKDHLKYNDDIEPDYEYIAGTIDWEEIEKDN